MPNLEEIQLVDCSSLKRLEKKKLPTLKRLKIDGCGEFETVEIESGGLPMLEHLCLFNLKKFQIGVLNDGVMPKLQYLYISRCPLLKRLGIDKLPNLKGLLIYGCDEFETLEIESGGLPMLKRLSLVDLKKFEIGVVNDGVMPKLQNLHISRCPMLKRLGIDKLPNLKGLQIDGCGEFETLEIESGGLPMLERLSLVDLKKFQIEVTE